MQSDCYVSVEHLSRDFGPVHAVKDISFEVRRGEVLGFLGPNGAGKTTTMRMLTGNLAPSRGRIRIKGTDLHTSPKQAKADIGYLPDVPPLHKDFTVDEYLLYCAQLHGIDRANRQKACNEVKQRCGLTGTGRRLIGNLSKGYQQRVGIAQAIIHSPSIIILDEPTVGLDPIQMREMRQLIRDLGGEHSVILSTHILPEVQATCDRVQIIHEGELVLTDTLANLDAKNQPTSLVLGLENPPAIETLRQLDHVTGVEALDGQQFRVHFDPERNPATSIAENAVTQQWGLTELTPERHGLEALFLQITSGDQTNVEDELVDNNKEDVKVT